jgi:hypothetical protein
MRACNALAAVIVVISVAIAPSQIRAAEIIWPGTNVRCTRCDEIVPIPHDSDDDGHQCSCKPPWFWLASVENRRSL